MQEEELYGVKKELHETSQQLNETSQQLNETSHQLELAQSKIAEQMDQLEDLVKNMSTYIGHKNDKIDMTLAGYL